MGQSKSGELQIVGESGADPLTRGRETALWNQATAYASAKQRPVLDAEGQPTFGPSTWNKVTKSWDQGPPIMGMENPFSEQYGRASSMPAMSAMTGAGQEYLTRSILGPDQYNLQNLGFADYVRPTSAAQSTEQQLAEIEKQRNQRTADQATRRKAREQQRLSGQWTAEQEARYRAERASGEDTFNVTEKGPGSLASTVGAFGGGTTRAASGLLGSRATEERYRSGMEQRPVLDAKGNPTGEYELVQVYDPRPYSQGVGIREIEEAGDATRRMLRQGEPGTPGYQQFLSEGWTKQDEAGIGETPGFERDVDGNLVPIKGFGFSGAQLEGPTYDAAGDLVTPGYRPGYDAIRGQVTGEGAAATRATPFGVEERDPFTFGSIDPATGEPRVDPLTGFPIGDVPAVTQGLISEQTGYGIEGAGQRIARNAAGDPIRDAAGELVMESALPMTEAQRELSQVGRTERPSDVWNPITGTWSSAAEAENIGFGEGDTDLTTIAGQTGYGTSGIGQRAVRDAQGNQVFDVDGNPIMESALGTSAEDRALSQIGQAAGPQQVFDPVTGEVRSAAERITDPTIAGLGQFMDPTTGELRDVMTPDAIDLGDPLTGESASAITQEQLAALGTTAPGTFGGASFLGGPAIQDYMNVAGVEGQIAQSEEDYQRQLNQLQARQAGTGAFGARAQLEDLGALEAQQRNIAAIRGAGYERAAGLMEADISREQQARMQEEQLTFQGGIRGQELEAQRRESDAARAQEAALAGRQLTAQEEMQTQALRFEGGSQAQQLAQQANIREAELGLEAARANQATALASGSQAQQIQAARQMRQAELNLQDQQQTRQIEAEAGMQRAGFGQQTAVRQAELEMEGARANQATALASGSQTQQLEASRQMRQAELNLQRQQATQALTLESGMQQAGFGQQAAIRQTELDLARQQATQGLGADAFMQQRQLGQQAAMASASNALAAAQSDQQAALASGNQAAALEAARRAQGAQAQMDIARQTQALGADAAGQQAQLEAARRQGLSEMGLQAGGMGLEAQAEFRQQQLDASQQLADIGAMRQGATFGAGEQLAGMGARQEQAQMLQQAWDYEQWLRGQEGFAPLMAFRQGMMPGGSMQEFARKPSKFGQILGAATSLGGAYLAGGRGRGGGGGGGTRAVIPGLGT